MPKSIPYTSTVSGTAGTCSPTKNTATFTTADTGTTDSASQTVTLCVGADLTVKKTADPSFTRTYAWSISKDVDKKVVEQLGGGTAAFNYTVTASETGFTDSGWKVSGKITVTNPNDWESVTLTSLTDAIDNGGSCTVDTSPGLTIAKTNSQDYSYSCTYSSKPAYNSNFTNTATANWDKSAASTPDGSAPGSKGTSFGSPTTLVDQSISVTDTYKGTLGTLTAVDATPYTVGKYTYQRTVAVPTSNCTKYDNTATFTTNTTGTTGNASQTVETCGPAATGALTIGY